MNPQRILIIACAACAACAATLPNYLLAQWNTRPLQPVPSVVTAPASGTTGPIVTMQPGTQFGTQPGVVTTMPPTVSAPPVITSQPNTQFTQPGIGASAPVIVGPQAVPNMPAPPPGSFGGPVYDPYYQQVPGAAPPPAALGAPLLPGGTNWNTFGSTAGITPRTGGGTLIGESVGLDDSYSWFQGFMPLFQTPGQNITFVDTRAIKFHEASGAFGFNLAGGYRWFSPAVNRVHGFYASYDYRNTGAFNFDQFSFGAESLGCLWDFRANGYLLLSSDTQFVSVTNLAFQNMNLVGTANYVDAFEGFDAEVGRNLTPASPTLDLRVFGGGYGFCSSGSKDAWGLRARIEATWWDRVSLGAAVQHDDVFNTSIYGTLSILFGGANRANSCACPTIADRLGDPIHKNMHVVVGGRSQPNTIINNPDDNMPLQILHIDSNALPGGDGSFETPLDALANAAADVDIVLLHAGSQFNDESITMDNSGQRLLGDSAAVPHTVESQFGTLTLPRANALSAKPILNGAAVPATGSTVIVTGADVEVSGLRIQDPDGSGILVQAAGLTGFNLNRNMISGTDFNNGGVGEGIHLNGNASGSITDNMLSGGNENGLFVSGSFNGTITGNTFNGNDKNGLLIEGAFQSGTISDNDAAGNTLNGFFFDSITGGLVDSNFAGNNGDDGFAILTAFTGGDFNNNTSNNNTGMGYEITAVPVAPASAADNNGIGNTPAVSNTFSFP